MPMTSMGARHEPAALRPRQRLRRSQLDDSQIDRRIAAMSDDYKELVERLNNGPDGLGPLTPDCEPAASAITALLQERDNLKQQYIDYCDSAGLLARAVAERDELRGLLKRSQPFVEQDAQMQADITRFSPEAESEKLLPLIAAALTQTGEKP